MIMNSGERQKVLLQYEQGYRLLMDALTGYPDTMWKYKPAPDQWSIHEIIIHITDSEVSSYIRCRCFIAEPGKTVMAYDQDQWAVKLDYHRQGTAEALVLFRLLRSNSALLIGNLPEHVWNHTINHPENGIMTMDDWLRMYADHVPVHIRQMERVYQSWKKSNVS